MIKSSAVKVNARGTITLLRKAERGKLPVGPAA